MLIVRCESCASRYRLPAQRVGDRGTKLKCPACGTAIEVRPPGGTAPGASPRAALPPGFDSRDIPTWPIGTDGGAPARAAQPATPAPGATDVPTALRALFAGSGEDLTVHPPGTVPPVQRVAGPRHEALSVTPPPPRSAARPGGGFLSRPSDRDALTWPPGPGAPRAPSDAGPARGPQASHDAPLRGDWKGTIPPPALRDDDLRVSAFSQDSQRLPLDEAPRAAAAVASALHGVGTVPGSGERGRGPVNRTGPTGGGGPPRSSTSDSGAQATARTGATGRPVAPNAQPASADPTPTYAPPWGATPGTPSAWQSYSTGIPTQTGVPTGTGAGAPPWAGTPYGHPGLSYAPPWGTGVPIGTHPGAPMVTSWQPTWVPAVVLGMERRTLVALLGVVMVVGFVGGCMGVGTSQITATAASLLGQTSAPSVVVVPPTPASAPGVQAVRAPPTLAPAAAPAPPPALVGASLPEVPTGRRSPRPPAPSAAAPAGEPLAPPPFEVDPSDVRDPWGDTP